MTVSEEGTAHSDYLFRRDKQLKDGYTMSQKNYRIVPEISKLKSKLVDKEQNISAKIVAQQPSFEPDSQNGISAKETIVQTSSSCSLNDNIVRVVNKNGEYEITFNDEIIYPKECPPVYVKEQKNTSSFGYIIFILVLLCIIASIGVYILKGKHTET